MSGQISLTMENYQKIKGKALKHYTHQCQEGRPRESITKQKPKLIVAMKLRRTSYTLVVAIRYYELICHGRNPPKKEQHKSPKHYIYFWTGMIRWDTNFAPRPTRIFPESKSDYYENTEYGFYWLNQGVLLQEDMHQTPICFPIRVTV